MNILTPENGLLYMKVGVHAKESLAEIIARKSREIEDEGFAMWGYGGNTCHPRTMVQPFAESYVQRSGAIYLCMQEIDSRHFADQVRANKYSADGINWQTVPSKINVLGSRFALVIEDLHHADLSLPLDKTRVAVGLSQGRPGNKYIRGQVDKACLELLDGIVERSQPEESEEIPINLVAKLKSPYAVFLRND